MPHGLTASCIVATWGCRPCLVDENAFLDAVLGPLGVEVALFSLLLRLSDPNDIGAWPATEINLVSDSLVVEAVVPRGLREWGIDDRVIKGGLRPPASLD
jgi:hypothetical protein